MRVHQITESLVDTNIKKILVKKGYKFVGGGQDQDTYIGPDGSVLKIFGTERGSGASSYTRGQQSFIDFADYCRKNPSNPYLPNILGWERFEYPPGSGNWYLQIKMERLFPFTGHRELAHELAVLANYVYRGGVQGAQRYLDAPRYDSEAGGTNKLIMNLGTDGWKQLTRALADLAEIARRKKYTYDLHSGNFMLSSDGDMVISDPFFTGTWRNR